MSVWLSVCLFFVAYARRQFWTELHEIWPVASMQMVKRGYLAPLEPAGRIAQAQRIDRRRREVWPSDVGARVDR